MRCSPDAQDGFLGCCLVPELVFNPKNLQSQGGKGEDRRQEGKR